MPSTGLPPTPSLTGRFEWERQLLRVPLKPTTKLVALGLAIYASADGTNAHPGVDRLAGDLGLKPRALLNHLAALRDLGLIVKTFDGSSKGRRGLADAYSLTVPAGGVDLTDIPDHLHAGAHGPTEQVHHGAGGSDRNTCTPVPEHLHAGTDHLHHGARSPAPTCTPPSSTKLEDQASHHVVVDAASRASPPTGVCAHGHALGQTCWRCWRDDHATDTAWPATTPTPVRRSS